MHVNAVNRAVVTVDSSVRKRHRRWNGICTFNPLLSVFDDVTACGPTATHTDVQLLLVVMFGRWDECQIPRHFYTVNTVICYVLSLFWDVYICANPEMGFQYPMRLISGKQFEQDLSVCNL